jgi:hypothetical protein
MASLCSSLNISDPAVRANAFRSWAERVADNSFQVAQLSGGHRAPSPTPPSPASSSDSFVEEAAERLVWLNDGAVACEPLSGDTPVSGAAQGGLECSRSNEECSQGTCDSTESEQRTQKHSVERQISERVWGESLQLQSQQDAELVIKQLQLNIAEGDRCAQCAFAPAALTTCGLQQGSSCWPFHAVPTAGPSWGPV